MDGKDKVEGWQRKWRGRKEENTRKRLTGFANETYNITMESDKKDVNINVLLTAENRLETQKRNREMLMDKIVQDFNKRQYTNACLYYDGKQLKSLLGMMEECENSCVRSFIILKAGFPMFQNLK